MYAMQWSTPFVCLYIVLLLKSVAYQRRGKHNRSAVRFGYHLGYQLNNDGAMCGVEEFGP